MSDRIDIKGLDQAELLRRLYNEARPVGMGALHYDPTPMTLGEAAELLAIARERGIDGRARFDYVKGRPIKVGIKGDELDGAMLYDRDQGSGHCQEIVDAMRAGQVGDTEVPRTRAEHVRWCKARAHEAYRSSGKLTDGVEAMLLDLDKHPETKALVTTGLALALTVQDERSLARFIDGFAE